MYVSKLPVCCCTSLSALCPCAHWTKSESFVRWIYCSCFNELVTQMAEKVQTKFLNTNMLAWQLWVLTIAVLVVYVRYDMIKLPSLTLCHRPGLQQLSAAGMMYFCRPEVSITVVPSTKSKQGFSLQFWIRAENKLCPSKTKTTCEHGPTQFYLLLFGM